MKAELTWEIVDNTRFIETRLIDAVRANHKAIMDKMTMLAKERAPKDTAALSLAIYNVGPWGSGYESAVSMARSAPGTRIEDRNQIAPPLVIERSPQRGVWLAALDVPITYIIWVHEGYYNILAQKIMPANPFVAMTFHEVFPEFMPMCVKDFQQILG